MIIGVMAVFAVSTSGAFAQSSDADSTAVIGTVHSAISKNTLVAHHDTLGNSTDTIAVIKEPVLSLPKDTLAPRKDTLDIITSEASFNTMPGFRVQLMSTQDLLEAINTRATADSLLSNYDVYIIYDSPYYKIRVGDFRAMYDANQATDYIAAHGFPDAWLVPDNVFRNPKRKNSPKDSIDR
jgi:hypothetical protein